MNKVYRIIDANTNRLVEALRVLEDFCRFYVDDIDFSRKLKDIRHKVCRVVKESLPHIEIYRDIEGDIGKDIKGILYKRENVESVVKANFNRSQEALRVLEEFSRVINISLSEEFEKARFLVYEIEHRLISKIRVDRFRNVRLYVILTESLCANPLIDTVKALVNGGVDAIQIREKEKSDTEIIDIILKVKEIIGKSEIILIVNDRPDIAYATDVDGVHLGQEDLPLKYAREILGYGKIIGRSTHSLDQGIKAEEEGADYIGVGPVFATQTKPGRPPVGLEYVRLARENIKIPFSAIGGINRDRVEDVIASGARTIAICRAIIGVKDVEQETKFYKNLIMLKNLEG